MRILESPDLGEPKAVWVAWLDILHAMPTRDESVQFAIRRAQAVIAELDKPPLA